jgi:hypothetical protein
VLRAILEPHRTAELKLVVWCRMRWTVHGIPRVPWKAEGIFDGVSTFKLDRKGKIYEHQVCCCSASPPMCPISQDFLGFGGLAVSSSAAESSHMHAWIAAGMYTLSRHVEPHFGLRPGAHPALIARSCSEPLSFLQVDNVILRDPPMLRSPLFAGLNLTPLLQPQPQTQPCPGAWYNNAPLAAEVQDSQPQVSAPQLPTEQGARKNGGSVLRGVRGILADDAAYLRQAFSDKNMQREVVSLLRQERFPQPPCQT